MVALKNFSNPLIATLVLPSRTVRGGDGRLAQLGVAVQRLTAGEGDVSVVELVTAVLVDLDDGNGMFGECPHDDLRRLLDAVVLPRGLLRSRATPSSREGPGTPACASLVRKCSVQAWPSSWISVRCSYSPVSVVQMSMTLRSPNLRCSPSMPIAAVEIVMPMDFEQRQRKACLSKERECFIGCPAL